MKYVSLLFLLFIFSVSFGQQKIYFFNYTGRPIQIQKRTILEIGSFPYVLDTNKQKLQNIPIDTENPMILNVMAVPASGAYGTADGVYYLFKNNDTVVVKLDKNRQPLITHISSFERTKELAFPMDLINKVNISPFYTLERKNASLLQLIYSPQISLSQRDHLIDSITRPYINAAQMICSEENIAPEIGELYQHHFEGMLVYYKLSAYNNKYLYKDQITDYYKDSLHKWMNTFTCEKCSNTPFYNLAMLLIYKTEYGNLTGKRFLDTISSETRGYTRDFILSRYMVDNMRETESAKSLLNTYDSLGTGTAYRQMVQNNSLLRSGLSKSDADLAVLLDNEKTKTGFNQLISRYKGKVVYMDFWASWCKPCLEEMTFSHQLSNRTANKNVVFLYVSIDTDFDSWKQASERLNINKNNSYILADYGQDKLSKQLNLITVPRYLIINKNGNLVNVDAGRPSEPNTYNVLTKLADN